MYLTLIALQGSLGPYIGLEALIRAPDWMSQGPFRAVKCWGLKSGSGLGQNNQFLIRICVKMDGGSIRFQSPLYNCMCFFERCVDYCFRISLMNKGF